MKERIKRNKVRQKVAVVCYRDAANYKTYMTMQIPHGLKINVGDDVDIKNFGIDESEWYNKILPERMLGFKYDPDLDHTIVEVQAVRVRKDADICVNTDEAGD